MIRVCEQVSESLGYSIPVAPMVIRYFGIETEIFRSFDLSVFSGPDSVKVEGLGAETQLAAV